MKSADQKIYWEERIDRFDVIYDDNKGLREITFLSKIVEPFRKKSLRERFEYAVMYLQEAGIKDKTFIDGGCGTGRFTEFLLSGGAAEVYAIDITERAIELAKARIAKSCPDKIKDAHFIVGDVTRVVLPRTDYFIGLGLVEYLEDIHAFLKNIKSRFIILNYPHKYHWKRIIRMVVEYFEKSTRHYYSAAEMKKVFQQNHFELQKRISFGASILEIYERT